MTENSVHPFRIHVPQADVDDLLDRLDRTRWPHPVPGSGGRTDFSRGMSLDDLRELADRWRHGFDWRAQEEALNEFGHVVTEIDGQRLHALHQRSPEPGAVPLLLAHGWPGDPVEMLDVVGPLADPVAHGGDAADAFHVVVPSLPGFGFSTPLSGTGWEVARTADAYAELMTRLGYERFAAHGSDIGSGVVGRLAATRPERVIGTHVAADGRALVMTGTMFPLPPDLDDDERAQLDAVRELMAEESAYYDLQNTKPDTIGPALVDSPVGQLAWIAEKLHAWTHPATTLADLDRDRLLTLVSVYWFNRAGQSSARFYYEASHSGVDWLQASGVPSAWAVFDSRPVARKVFDAAGLVSHWSEFDAGGHFPALEEPGLLLEDLRDFFRTLR